MTKRCQLFLPTVPNLEKEVAKPPVKDGWIIFNDFMKLAYIRSGWVRKSPTTCLRNI